MPVLIRPVQATDLEGLMTLAKHAGPGMTNLPANADILEEKIALSLKNFQPEFVDVQTGLYFFVMEDVDTHAIVGCSAIAGRANPQIPLYHFKVTTEVLHSRLLNFSKEHQVLYIVNDYHHTSEVCSLFVLPAFRHSHHGTLISRARFLFMAQHPTRFSPKIIAELRGYIDEKNRSPFWYGLARKFLPGDYSRTDQLIGAGEKQFIRDLLPQVPIFASLLPKSARAAMGKVQIETVPAYQVLYREGFEYNHYIDLFDGGPTLEAWLAHIVSVKKSRLAKVARILTKCLPNDNPMLISNIDFNFLACQGTLNLLPDGTVEIDDQSANLLQVSVGDSIRFISIHYPKEPS